MKKPPEPTQEEIEKVAAWWEWVRIASCTHSNGFSVDSLDHVMKCSDCGERLYVMSESQMTEEQIARRKS